MFAIGFFDEVTKLGSTAAGRYLRADTSGATAKRLAPRIVSAMRSGKIDAKDLTIKRLGQGGSQTADLVVSPDFGLSARKYLHPNINKLETWRGDPEKLRLHLGSRKYDTIAGHYGSKQIPEAPGRKVDYWEPVFGDRSNVGKRTYEKHVSLSDNFDKRRTRYESLLSDRISADDPRADQPDRYRRFQEAMNAVRRRSESIPHTPQMAADVSALEQRIGDRVHDANSARNIVGGKIVDMDTGTQMRHMAGSAERRKQNLAETREAMRHGFVSVTPVGARAGARRPPEQAQPASPVEAPSVPVQPEPPPAESRVTRKPAPRKSRADNIAEPAHGAAEPRRQKESPRTAELNSIDREIAAISAENQRAQQRTRRFARIGLGVGAGALIGLAGYGLYRRFKNKTDEKSE